jgi:hypothetical protein
VQRPSGGRQHDQARGGREQPAHHAGGAVQLLEVVQHQQGPAITQVPGHGGSGGPVGGHVQAVGDGLPHHPGIADGRQRDKEHPVREVLIQRCCSGQR